jgi:hypothetical protein
MTKEQKDILVKDLCARLPYGVKVRYSSYYEFITCTLQAINPVYNTIDLWSKDACFNPVFIDKIKPYLFPLSNMTKEQYEEWCDLEAEPLDEILTRNSNGEKMSTLEHHLLIAKSLTDPIHYCYKNHFDIYGLIPMGLALDATGKNIY